MSREKFIKNLFDSFHICQLCLKVNLMWLLVLQIVIWIVIPATRNSRADHANNTLALIVLIQYIPRLFLIFPLNQRIIKTTGLIARTAWAGAAYNLLLYMLASHVHIWSPIFTVMLFPLVIAEVKFVLLAVNNTDKHQLIVTIYCWLRY